MREWKNGEIAYLVFQVVMVSVIVTFSITHGCTQHHYETEAKERGYAHHNSETGKWEWKEKKGE